MRRSATDGPLSWRAPFTATPVGSFALATFYDTRPTIHTSDTSNFGLRPSEERCGEYALRCFRKIHEGSDGAKGGERVYAIFRGSRPAYRHRNATAVSQTSRLRKLAKINVDWKSGMLRL
jgi:hypothetical protein